MIAFLAGLALASEPWVRVGRPGPWWITPDGPAGEAPAPDAWRPVEGRFVAADGDRVRATFRTGDFDVSLWVARADCDRRITARVDLARKPGGDPSGVTLLGGAPVTGGDVDGDAVLVTYAGDGILTTGWVPAAAVDEVWTRDGVNIRYGNLQPDAALALRSRPRGPVTAILAVGEDRFWTLWKMSERGRWTEAGLSADDVEARGWVRTADVAEVEEYGFGRGFGSGGFGCSHCELVAVPAGTEVRAPTGEPFAVAHQDGELVVEGPLTDGVLPVSVPTPWGRAPGTIACGSLLDGTCTP